MNAPAPVKRFVVFACPDYYPAGGWGDFVDSFDELEFALNVAHKEERKGYLAHVIDLRTGQDVFR